MHRRVLVSAAVILFMALPTFGFLPAKSAAASNFCYSSQAQLGYNIGGGLVQYWSPISNQYRAIVGWSYNGPVAGFRAPIFGRLDTPFGSPAPGQEPIVARQATFWCSGQTPVQGPAYGICPVFAGIKTIRLEDQGCLYPNRGILATDVVQSDWKVLWNDGYQTFNTTTEADRQISAYQATFYYSPRVFRNVSTGLVCPVFGGVRLKLEGNLCRLYPQSGGPASGFVFPGWTVDYYNNYTSRAYGGKFITATEATFYP